MYFNTHSCKFWNLSLYFSYLVPSTAPNYGTVPLKVFGSPDFVFFPVTFLCLPPLLAFSVLVLVWLLMFSEGVGVWTDCVSSPIFLNVAPGSLLVGILLPFFLLGGSSVFSGFSFSSFLLLDRGSDKGTCLEFSSDLVSDQGNCLEFFSTIYLFILSSYILK